jgi:hypothetical protein
MNLDDRVASQRGRVFEPQRARTIISTSQSGITTSRYPWTPLAASYPVEVVVVVARVPDHVPARLGARAQVEIESKT